MNFPLLALRCWANPRKTTALAADQRPAHQKDRDHLRTDQIFKRTFTNSKLLPIFSVRFQCRRWKFWAIFFPRSCRLHIFFSTCDAASHQFPCILICDIADRCCPDLFLQISPPRGAFWSILFSFFLLFFPSDLNFENVKKQNTLWRMEAQGFAVARPGTALGKRGQRVSGCGHFSIYVQLFMVGHGQGSVRTR